MSNFKNFWYEFKRELVYGIFLCTAFGIAFSFFAIVGTIVLLILKALTH